MADTMLVAFGRFLRMLRERRGLSLDHVEALTAAYPEPVSKVYLSRVENGHSRIAFSRMIALCRAYDYPIDAASERLWLDLGVDKMEDAPDTSGKGAKELLRAGRDFVRKGFRWHAYACARDAIAVAKTSPVSESFRDHEEQFGICLMNTATGAAILGRTRFALEEYFAVETMDSLSANYQSVLQERIAGALRRMGRLDEARDRVDKAIEVISRADATPFLGECLTTRALIAGDDGQPSVAIELYRRAFQLYRKQHNDHEASNVLANLAQTSLDLGRLGAARRFLAAAERYAKRLDLANLQVRVLILRGEMAEARGDDDGAERCWKEGQRLAAGLRDSVLTFKVKYFLYRHASRIGRPAFARRLRKALVRLSPWIPVDTPELEAFRRQETAADHRTRDSEFPLRNNISSEPETRTRSAP